MKILPSLFFRLVSMKGIKITTPVLVALLTAGLIVISVDFASAQHGTLPIAQPVRTNPTSLLLSGQIQQNLYQGAGGISVLRSGSEFGRPFSVSGQLPQPLPMPTGRPVMMGGPDFFPGRN